MFFGQRLAHLLLEPNDQPLGIHAPRASAAAPFSTLATAQRLLERSQTMHMRHRRRAGMQPTALLLQGPDQNFVEQFLIPQIECRRIVRRVLLSPIGKIRARRLQSFISLDVAISIPLRPGSIRMHSEKVNWHNNVNLPPEPRMYIRGYCDV